MNGIEHYEAAERFVDHAAGDVAGSNAQQFNLARAQIHAVLSIAAFLEGIRDGITRHTP